MVYLGVLQVSHLEKQQHQCLNNDLFLLLCHYRIWYSLSRITTFTLQQLVGNDFLNVSFCYCVNREEVPCGQRRLTALK